MSGKGSGALSDLSKSYKSIMLFAGNGYLNATNSYIMTPRDQMSTADLYYYFLKSSGAK